MIDRVGIVGAGLIGRMIAIELAMKGVEVTLFDRDNRNGSLSCGWTGAGMLAPYAELDQCDQVVFRLGLNSLELWPALLLKLTGRVFFQQNGSLILAHAQDRAELLRFRDRVEGNLREGEAGHGGTMPPRHAKEVGVAPIDGIGGLGIDAGEDARALGRPQAPTDQHYSEVLNVGALHAAPGFHGLFTSPIQWLDAEMIHDLEPDLPDRFSGGLFLPDEGQIDNRQLLQALEATLNSLALAWYAHSEVHTIEPQCVTFSHGTALKQTQNFDCVIDCRGLGARTDIADLRGVRGELIVVHAPEVHLNRPVRLMHPRYPLYVVPREDNRFLIGATTIESEDRSPITVQSALELLSAAFSLHPGFAQASIEEMRVNCRPALSDNRPRIFHQEGLLRVNGLYRHGFLIAPKLVHLVVSFLETGELEQDFSVLFSEEKFAGAGTR